MGVLDDPMIKWLMENQSEEFKNVGGKYQKSELHTELNLYYNAVKTDTKNLFMQLAQDKSTASNIKDLLQSNVFKALINNALVQTLMKSNPDMLIGFAEKYKDSEVWEGPNLYYETVSYDTLWLFEHLAQDETMAHNLKLITK